MPEPGPGARKFIYAADMQALKAKADELRGEVERLKHVEGMVEAIVEDIADVLKADDWKQRFEFVVVSYQDFKRGVITEEELQTRVRQTVVGLDDQLSPEVMQVRHLRSVE